MSSSKKDLVALLGDEEEEKYPVPPAESEEEADEDAPMNEEEEEDEKPIKKKKDKKRERAIEEDEEGHLHRASLQSDNEDDVGFTKNKKLKAAMPKGFLGGVKAVPYTTADSDGESDEDDEAAAFKPSGRDALLIKLMTKSMPEIRELLEKHNCGRFSNWITKAGSRKMFINAIGKLVRKKLKSSGAQNTEVSDAVLNRLLDDHQESIIKEPKAESVLAAGEEDDDEEEEEEETSEDRDFVASDSEDVVWESDKGDDDEIPKKPSSPARKKAKPPKLTHEEVKANAQRKRKAAPPSDSDNESDGIGEDDAFDTGKYLGIEKKASFDESTPASFKTKAGLPPPKKTLQIDSDNDEDDDNHKKKKPPALVEESDHDSGASGSDEDEDGKKKKRVKRVFVNADAKKQYSKMDFAVGDLFISAGHEYEVYYRGKDARLAKVGSSEKKTMSGVKRRLLSKEDTWIDQTHKSHAYEHLSTCLDIPAEGKPSSKKELNRKLCHFLISAGHPPVRISAPVGKAICHTRIDPALKKQIFADAAVHSNVVTNKGASRLLLPWKQYDDLITKSSSSSLGSKARASAAQSPAKKMRMHANATSHKPVEKPLFNVDSVNRVLDFMFKEKFPEDISDENLMIRVGALKKRAAVFDKAIEDNKDDAEPMKAAVMQVLSSSSKENPVKLLVDISFMMTPACVEILTEKHSAALKRELHAMED